MNVVLLADKKVRKTYEAALKDDPNITLVGCEMVLRGNTLARIADHHNPHILIIHNKVQVKDDLSINDLISFLRVKKPNMRIIYIYGEVADLNVFIETAESLIDSGITDIVTSYSVNTAIDTIISPITEEAIKVKIKDMIEEEEKSKLVVEDDDIYDQSFQKLDLSFPALTTIDEFNIDNVLVISEKKQDYDTFVIGIGQLQHHNGCTHTALEFATLLNKKNKVAVVIADDDTYERLAVFHRINPLAAKEGMKYNDIDIYPYSMLPELYDSYSVLIVDYSYMGSEYQKNQFAKSDVKILLASAAEWDIAYLMRHVEYNDERYTRNINILLPRVSKEKFTKYNKQFLKSGVNAYRLCDSPDWTSPNAENLNVYKAILTPYIINPNIKKAKRRLFRIKGK